MDIPNTDDFKNLNQKTFLWVIGSGMLGVLLVAVIVSFTSPDKKDAPQRDMRISAGTASYLNNRPDSLTDPSLKRAEGFSIENIRDSTLYNLPAPNKLFKSSGLNMDNYDSRKHRPPTRPGYGHPYPRRRTPPRTNKETKFDQALESDIAIFGEGEKSKQNNYIGPANSNLIDKYQQKIDHIKNGSYQNAGQSFKKNNHHPISSHFQRPRTPYTLQEGTLISASLVTGINSELPGSIIAIVNRNIYDSIRQKYLLIPKGAKLIGSYDERVIIGQHKLLMSWQRIIFPDGRSLDLPDLNTHDLQGQSGLAGKVNNHFWKIFGQSAMLSLLGAGMQIAYPQSGGGGMYHRSAGQMVASSIANSFNRHANQILSRNSKMRPTITIPAGTNFNIFLAGDISFKQPYDYSPPVTN